MVKLQMNFLENMHLHIVYTGTSKIKSALKTLRLARGQCSPKQCPYLVCIRTTR